MSTATLRKLSDVRRIRRLLLAGTALLLLLVAVFFGSGRLRRLAFHLDLPSRLGADIAQTADGFTYSQSDAQGHTLFTIRASHLIEYKRDEAELKGATITLYGPPGSNRSDRISGADFFYNRKTGVARAPGAVTIDFAPPARQDKGANGTSTNIHVVTSGLTFTQASGQATTDQRVDFSTPRASGSSVGAQYTAKTGLLVLDHQVALSIAPDPGASAGASPTLIHAAHAQLLRDQHRALLDQADTVAEGNHATSDHATISFREDGSAEHLLAEGHLHITTATGADLHAGVGNADLDDQSQPTFALLTGGVTYAEKGTGEPGSESTDASAQQATLRFLPAAQQGARAGQQERARPSLQHAQFQQAVHVFVDHAGLANDPAGHATRELNSATLNVDFLPGAQGQAVAQRAVATGSASVVLRDLPSHGNGPAKRAKPGPQQGGPQPGASGTDVKADTLVATLADGHQLRTLDGTGHTEVVDLAADGAESSSAGDTLHAVFADHRTGATESANAIDTAIQTGHVLLTQTPAPRANSEGSSNRSAMHGTGERAEYHGSNQLLELTGLPHQPPTLSNDETELSATRVDYHRETGDAEAWGDVRATDHQQPQQGSAAGHTQAQPAGTTLGGDGPVHVTADHARLLHASKVSYFYAAPGQLARMWQGADQVNAPVLILDRDKSTLDARASEDGGASSNSVVHATLGARSGVEAGGGSHKGGANAAMRVVAGTLHYSDAAHRADFDTGVVAQQGLSTIRSAHTAAFFSTPKPNQPSQLDHLLATGDVVLTQPGRRATGQQLLYTASDERYVLTGTAAAPPRATDREHGTTTGAALVFTNDADEQVQVLDKAPGSGATTPHTTTDTTAPR